jgi:hypothetical protein
MACCCLPSLVLADETAVEPVGVQFTFQEARQFDFWIGIWDVNLRTRQEDLTWQDSVNAEAHVWRILDGKATLELWDSRPIKGFGLRWFDPVSHEWILWLNWPRENTSGGSSLAGTFRHGRGEFFSTFHTQDGKEGLSRYTFSDIAADRLRWDDGFSIDGGKTWSENWIMEFTRRQATPPWPIDSDTARTYHDGSRCDREEFRVFEGVVGCWKGTVTKAEEMSGEQTRTVMLSGHKILDGCAVMVFLVSEDLEDEEFRFLTYNTYAEKLEENRLDDRLGTDLRVAYGDARAEKVLLHGRGDSGERVEWDLGESDVIRLREYEVPPDGSEVEGLAAEFQRD